MNPAGTCCANVWMTGAIQNRTDCHCRIILWLRLSYILLNYFECTNASECIWIFATLLLQTHCLCFSKTQKIENTISCQMDFDSWSRHTPVVASSEFLLQIKKKKRVVYSLNKTWWNYKFARLHKLKVQCQERLLYGPKPLAVPSSTWGVAGGIMSHWCPPQKR